MDEYGWVYNGWINGWVVGRMIGWFMGWFDYSPFQSRGTLRHPLALPPWDPMDIAEEVRLLRVNLRKKQNMPRESSAYSQQVERQALEVPLEEGLGAHADQH